MLRKKENALFQLTKLLYISRTQYFNSYSNNIWECIENSLSDSSEKQPEGEGLQLKRKLGLFSAVAFTVGCIIGNIPITLYQ